MVLITPFFPRGFAPIKTINVQTLTISLCGLWSPNHVPLSPVPPAAGSLVAFLPLFQTFLEALHLDPLTPGVVVSTPDHDPYHQQYQPVTDVHCCSKKKIT